MRRWESWMDYVVLERYADERNSVLCEELGVGLRTLERHAANLGVRKSPDFIENRQKKASQEAARWVDYMKITGQKIRKSYGGGGFKKGHHFDSETEARRVKAIRDRAWDERVRMIRGWTRKTGWKMVDYGVCGEKKK